MLCTSNVYFLHEFVWSILYVSQKLGYAFDNLSELKLVLQNCYDWELLIELFLVFLIHFFFTQIIYARLYTIYVNFYQTIYHQEKLTYVKLFFISHIYLCIELDSALTAHLVQHIDSLCFHRLTGLLHDYFGLRSQFENYKIHHIFIDKNCLVCCRRIVSRA